MSSSSTMRPLRILFVEDNDYLRELTAELLTAPDREIVACGSAEDALALFEKDPCHVVITDVSLPAMSGIDLTRRLLKLVPNLWVVVCSGYQFDVGMDKFGPNVRALAKPFETDQIDAILTKAREVAI